MSRAQPAAYGRDRFEHEPLRPNDTRDSPASSFLLMLFFSSALFALGLTVTLS
ncbi:hypothetical protein [Chelatococcus reniformis]|uniref:Uncharacterized protein n=1 Tax=Chelatococcus reniformis TaxID=1494448 RepID=A0A916UGT9_9HYPH|nr:hypothetical protein [Chelatococcus reniformis]GGC71615.1 hypothetical protein GCM10010994_32620 [Chelatococcus reniformis]